MRITLLLAVIITGLTSMTSVAAKNYYKWTDAEGVTHYSARKPHDEQADVVSVTTGGREVEGPADGSSGNDEGSESAGTDSGSDTADNNQDAERCEAARKNLEVLRNNARVRKEGEDGEMYYLSEDDKAEETSKLEQVVDEAC